MASGMSNWDNNAPMGDMRGPEDVEVKVSKAYDGELRLWVNVNGQCRLRIYGIKPEAYHYVEDNDGRD